MTDFPQLLGDAGTTWAAIAAIAAAVSSLATLGGLALILRDKRAQEAPTLFVDVEGIVSNRADKKLLSPKREKDEWVHEMVATLGNVGPGAAYAVEFKVSLSGDGVETLRPGREFIQFLPLGQEREMHIVFHTRAEKHPVWFAYEPIPRDLPEPMPVVDMRAAARDRSGRIHTFDSRMLRMSQHDRRRESLVEVDELGGAVAEELDSAQRLVFGMISETTPGPHEQRTWRRIRHRQPLV